MAALSQTEKHQIVVLLAQFTSYSDVAVIMREQFGVDIERFQVRTYDPSNARYAAGERWREVFNTARATYLASIEAIPMAHLGFRLNSLQRLFDKASARGNLVLACAILEQAAKEVGGTLTNARSVTVEPSEHSFRHLSPEERRARVAEMLREALSSSGSTDRSPPSVTAKAA